MKGCCFYAHWFTYSSIYIFTYSFRKVVPTMNKSVKIAHTVKSVSTIFATHHISHICITSAIDYHDILHSISVALDKDYHA